MPSKELASGASEVADHITTAARVTGSKVLPRALDPWIDLVGGAEIEDQHVVFTGMDRGFEAARELNAPLRRRPRRRHGDSR